ncbi:MAG: lipoate--protein ligase [Clostridia bacterium]|nr:lipoate--protein ligase [Clostridia bacterium]
MRKITTREGTTIANLLYVSTSPDGWRNLGVDEYFLDHIGEDDMLLYFYVNRNAVIIGRGQNPWAECNLNAMERDGVQLVRRITGGGAVFHDEGNLNFSFIAGEKRYDLQRQLGMILDAVRALGIPCEFSGRNDLLADGRKFSGNAFCSRGSVRQHHGTLLIDADLTRLQNYLNVDPRKLQAKGAKSVRSRVCNLSQFVPGLKRDQMLEALKLAFGETYGPFIELQTTNLDEAAIAPYVEKQRSEEWRLGKTPRFDLEIENRFPWGNVQLLLTLRQSRVDEISVYSDAMDADLADEIRSRLLGVAFGSAPLAAALRTSEKEQLHQLADFIAAQNL